MDLTNRIFSWMQSYCNTWLPPAPFVGQPPEYRWSPSNKRNHCKGSSMFTVYCVGVYTVYIYITCIYIYGVHIICEFVAFVPQSYNIARERERERVKRTLGNHESPLTYPEATSRTRCVTPGRIIPALHTDREETNFEVFDGGQVVRASKVQRIVWRSLHDLDSSMLLDRKTDHDYYSRYSELSRYPLGERKVGDILGAFPPTTRGTSWENPPEEKTPSFGHPGSPADC